TEDEQDQIVKQISTFLYQLHNIPIEVVRLNNILQSDVNRGYDDWVRLFEDVQRELFPYMWPYSKEWAINHFEPILRDSDFMNYEPKLIDGDLAPYHILFNRKEKMVSGIVDFGTAGIGDPAADFACIIYQYGESFLEKISKYYPEVDNYIERARF